MKKLRYLILLYLLLLCCTTPTQAQGTVHIVAGTSVKTSGDGYFVLNDMNLVNNGVLQQTSNNDFVKLTGGLDVSLSGSGINSIGSLLLAKGGAAKLTLHSNITLATRLDFSSGLIDLDNAILNLGTTGVFLNESEVSRAYSGANGYIEATQNLNAPSAVNVGNLGAVITSPSNLGLTTIRRGHAVQSNVYGVNSSIRRYYDILPASNTGLNATLRFRYFDAELNSLDEATLSLWKSTDHITWNSVGYSNKDLSSNYLEKTAINDFSRWTLATAIRPSITCPSNIVVSNDPGKCSALVNLVGSNAATSSGIPAPVVTYSVDQNAITTSHVFPVGITTVSARASNGILPDATCSFTVRVVDNQAPVINTIVKPVVLLWSPNHKYQKLNVTQFVTSVQDNCGPIPVSSVVISKVTSDEPDNAAGDKDGNTTQDIKIAAACKAVELRSERIEGGNGRVYTIHFRVTDGKGNIATATAKAVVLPNQSGTAAIEDGPAYTVNGNCNSAGALARIAATKQAADKEQELQVRALPNPSSTYFTLLIQSNSGKAVTVRIVDVLGRTVEGRPEIASNGSLQVGHSYPPGMYFARVVQGEKMVIVKLIKQGF